MSKEKIRFRAGGQKNPGGISDEKAYRAFVHALKYFYPTIKKNLWDTVPKSHDGMPVLVPVRKLATDSDVEYTRHVETIIRIDGEEKDCPHRPTSTFCRLVYGYAKDSRAVMGHVIMFGISLPFECPDSAFSAKDEDSLWLTVDMGYMAMLTLRMMMDGVIDNHPQSGLFTHTLEAQ